MKNFLILTLSLLICVSAYAMECHINRSQSGYSYDSGAKVEDFPKFMDTIKRGMSVTILNKVEVAVGGKADPHYFGCKIRYELWDEIYTIESLTPPKRSRKTKTLAALPEECTKDQFAWPKAVEKVEATTALNPISEKQMQRTRQWLAKKGIGAGSSRLFGRAVNALMDLESDKVLSSQCTVRGED